MRWLTVCATIGPAGCVSGRVPGSGGGSDSGSSNAPPPSRTPVTNTAEEAWPDRGAQPDALTPKEIAHLCIQLVECNSIPDLVDLGWDDSPDALDTLDTCVAVATYSAERAIPLTYFGEGYNERVEYLAECVSTSEACEDVAACLTPQPPDLECEEAGCRGSWGVSVTCEGEVATITLRDETHVRDCSRAYAKCDPDTSTGCTDRPFTKCHGGTGARCDGNVLLGCDDADLLSYHDCSRMGGTCEELAGERRCVYPDSSPLCPSTANWYFLPTARCGDAAMLTVCIAERVVELPRSALCGAASG